MSARNETRRITASSPSKNRGTSRGLKKRVMKTGWVRSMRKLGLRVPSFLRLRRGDLSESPTVCGSRMLNVEQQIKVILIAGVPDTASLVATPPTCADSGTTGHLFRCSPHGSPGCCRDREYGQCQNQDSGDAIKEDGEAVGRRDF